MTTSGRWQRVGALFDRALAAAPPHRLDVVRSSSEPADVQEEVLVLLQSHESSEGFLEPPSIFEPGSTVGAYRIERILGRGGMGVVYLAHDTRLHRPVALKSLPPHMFRDDRMRARLRQEARAAAALSHPSIATVYALEEIGDHIFIATEYLDGPTLREEINKGPIAIDRALEIARAIASALTAAHARGITHRDLKPENIILCAGAVKVVDFGLAQFDVTAQDLASVTRLTEAGVVAGTPPYMAPEQLLGQPTSTRTDQFAFGVLLYELLTGRHPFGSGALPNTIARTIATDPDPADDVPPHLWDVINRAMQKNPEERYASTADLAADLNHNPPFPGTVGITSPRSPAPSVLPSPGAVGVTSPRSQAFRWWRIHQLIVAWVYWAMVFVAWHVHEWTGRWGIITFFVTLAIVIVGANTRFHLAFTASTYPEQLAVQRARIGRLVYAADIGFALMMIGTGLVIAGDHPGWGAVTAAFGLGAAIGFLVIEPTTARAAFGSQSHIRNPKSEI